MEAQPQINSRIDALEKELALKNRELEIEAALERVRTVAMSMNEPADMLEVCKTISHQLELLGIKEIRNMQTAIFYENKSTYMNYEYYTKHNKTIVTETSYTNHEIPRAFANQMLKGNGEIFITHIKGEDVKDWIAYQKTTNVFIDDYLYTASSLNYYWHSLGAVALGISTYEPLTEEEKNLFNRFLKVFELAYRRYLDIEQAEGQAKEAQIELALERVRARTMAMQKSDELSETAYILFQQFKELGENPLQITIGIFNEEKKVIEFRITGLDGSGSKIDQAYNMDINEPVLLHKIYAAWKEQRKSAVIELTGKDLRHWSDYKSNIGGVAKSASDISEDERRFVSVGFFSKGMISFSKRERIPEETIKILERFAIVFDQTYTRFLDLQKAEAQARESQIQLALERVRARTMAMQKSDELAEVATILFQQVKLLGVPQWVCGFSIWEIGDKEFTWYPGDPDGVILPPAKVPLTEHTVFRQYDESRKRGDELFIYEKEGEVQADHYRYMYSLPGMHDLLQSMLDAGLQFPTFQIDHLANFSHGNLIFITYKHFPEMHDVFKRFAKVFEQTYTRFLDLQKAEAQAREAQIEAALERVRSKTMAMHNSADVADTVATLFDELIKLGIETIRCGIGIMKPSYQMELWTAKSGSNGKVDLVTGQMDMSMHSLLQGAYNGWKNKEEFFSYELKDDDLINYYTLINNHPEYPIKYDLSTLPSKIFHNDFYFSEGTLFVFSPQQLSEEISKIFKRFAAVFGQTYRRYLDLQKAEAQAREATIEAALERVRAKTMAMHKSEQLAETAKVFFEQFDLLGKIPDRMSIGIFNEESKKAELWVTDQSGNQVNHEYFFSIDERTSITKIYTAWKERKDTIIVDLTGQNLQDWLQFVKEEAKLPIDERKIKGRRVQQAAFFSKGFLLFTTHEPVAGETMQLLVRFARVFDLTYTRFLDLQKAEAQAREAQIEAALERIRSRTMAMHKSGELLEVIMVMSEQLKHLKFKFDNVTFGINSEGYDFQFWSAIPGQSYPDQILIPYFDHPMMNRVRETKEKGLDFLADIFTYEEKNNWLQHLFRSTIVKDIAEERKKYMLDSAGFARSVFFMKQIALVIGNYDAIPYSDEENAIFKRFANVFEQSYTRFLDLKQAETQAREVQIEAAMEKVRARAMAMQKPDELVEVALLLRKEMSLLGVEELETSSIYIHDEATGKTECWYAIMKEDEQEKKLVSDHMTIDLTETWVGRQMLAFYHSDKKQISIPMKGAERKEWINYCTDHSKVLAGFCGDNIPNRTYHLYKFLGGYMGAASPGDISAESWNLLQRATSVFALAYTRFSDLIKSEANAKEAVKRAALDRIRADIASMRTISDLDRITPLIWNELTILGLPFIRCGVFIMDDPQQLIHTFLSTPDGKAIAAFHLPYATPGRFAEIVDHWRNKTIYVSRWTEDDFTSIAENLIKQGAITTKEQYLDTLPKEGFYLHFLPFLQGMLYVGNTTQLGEEEIKLIQSVADAFSTAYARYEDFNKLESAKQQVEKTLTDLKQAQQQLIQSEKMASLGELTAGIAHEIQNPLNFVNNFSEVSNELIIEMVDEVDKGNTEEIKAIAQDVQQNLEKILHHGKRADAIVKGMLQHSRVSTGQKEPTDINTLTDEYLRLSYHGLRAKDKSFNAILQTDFDTTIEKINIVPQDIGRVLLNLFNNAFYAVTEKRKRQDENYQPMVSVSTKKIKDKVEIRIKDNGLGISEKNLKKIYQPFFTTKPSGQGTGLGLSLSYDIITKAHGGEIKVETEEEKFAEFIVVLPA